MVFYPPAWVPKLPFDPPDTIPINEFMLEDKWGRQPIEKSKPFFVCGHSGKTLTGPEVKERVDYLARGLAKELGWRPNEGTEWDKVCGVFSLNAVSNLFWRVCIWY
jgi:ribosome assembly protein SQT1